MPVCLLLAIAVWYVFLAQRVPQDTPVTSPALPPPEVVAAASPPAPESPDAKPPADDS